MCGILIEIRKSSKNKNSLNNLIELIKCRGPDNFNNTSITLNNGIIIDFYSTVLHLRGLSITVQPLVDVNGNVLCFNGQIFDSFNVPLDQNDGQVLFEHLNSFVNHLDLENYLKNLNDPYSFVYYSKNFNKLYFGRDLLGRRSLNLFKDDMDSIIISSLTDPRIGLNWIECDVRQLYEVNLNDSFTVNQHQRDFDLKLLRKNNNSDADDNNVQDIPLNILNDFSTYLTDAVDRRVKSIPAISNSNDGKVAILFSGGIDCTIVAHLVSKILPSDSPIELINVAFCSTPNASLETIKDTCSKAPDRQTAIESLEELKTIHPNRQFRLVNVDIPPEIYNNDKQTIIELMFPKNTVMDLSLAAPLYFASRGQGYLYGSDVEYTCQSKVLLSGLGADEALGGYGRHRVTYMKGGWEAMADELEMDIMRLPFRNLGRDDRIISHHGREVRFPFLSIPLLKWLSTIPLEFKADYRLPELGDKRLLRTYAYNEYLRLASKRSKRAMQFGSRSSRMDGAGSGSKVKGDDTLILKF